MITGVLTASRQAVIRPTVRGSEGQEQEIDAVIDMGFDGTLTLPPVLIVTLGLVCCGEDRGIVGGMLGLWRLHRWRGDTASGA